MDRRLLIVVAALAGVLGCAAPPEPPANPVQGAWRVVSMDLISAEGDTVAVPIRESLVLFGDRHYSMTYAFGQERSPAYAERWHPSDAEKVARFGSMIVNGGSYRIQGSRLHARPEFALAPEFVGGEGVFSFASAGDTLELTWEKSIAVDGLEYPSRGTVTLLRLVRVE